MNKKYLLLCIIQNFRICVISHSKWKPGIQQFQFHYSFHCFTEQTLQKKKTNLSAEDKVKWLNMTLLKRTVCDNSIPMATA